jgi:murein DD-endopeptidase MepM/ murein hydrolase activator NlpD
VLLVLAVCVLGACARSQPEIIVITATPSPIADGASIATPMAGAAAPFFPTMPVGQPTLAQAPAAAPDAQIYTVQAGDTLSSIALAQGTTIDMLYRLNALTDIDRLEVGQILILPSRAVLPGSDAFLLPDGRVVRGPDGGRFDIAGAIAAAPGYLRSAVDQVDGAFLNAAQVVERVSLEYSVDARVLLALLEMRAGLLSNPNPADAQRDYALGAPASRFGFDRRGLYRQLAWAADQLNAGYYGWKYRGLTQVTFEDGARAEMNPRLNAGTAALQTMLAQYRPYDAWRAEVAELPAVYRRLFGEPPADLVPFTAAALVQPALRLPFREGETWFFTGGPHGGWGTGSAWAAVDFAPPDDPAEQTTACYRSQYPVTASADGVIARSGGGAVVLDLDGDGDEATGWTVFYLHIDAAGRIPAGTRVAAGDRIGYASCEGGVSNGTHVHIARRYNGEWLPADCSECSPAVRVPSFTFDGWTVVGLRGQEYQGYLVRGSERKVAEAMRGAADNRVTHD